MLTTGATPSGDDASTVFVTAAVLLVLLLEYAELRVSWSRTGHHFRHALGVHVTAAAAALVVGSLTHLRIAAEAACAGHPCLFATRCSLLGAFLAYLAVLATAVLLDDRFAGS